MKTKSLSQFEQKVMNIVWDCGHCSVRDVLEKISANKKLAYTTIATILNRLYSKGLVRRINHGSLLYYSPKISKKDFGKTTATNFLRKFFITFGETSVTSFAESIDRLPKDKKNYLLKLLEEKK